MDKFLFAIEGDVDAGKLAALEGQGGVKSRARGRDKSGFEDIDFGLLIECDAESESAAVARIVTGLGIPEDRIYVQG